MIKFSDICIQFQKCRINFRGFSISQTLWKRCVGVFITVITLYGGPASAHHLLVKLKERVNSQTPTPASQRIVAIQSDSAQHMMWLEKAQADGRVEFVENDSPIYGLTITEDPMFKHQWALHNDGKNNWVKGPAGEDVQALESWNFIESLRPGSGGLAQDPLGLQVALNGLIGSDQIIVAMVDSGLKIDHPELQNNIYTNTIELNGVTGVDDDKNGFVDDIHGWDFVDNDNSTDDVNNHGTHIAGIIGARHDGVGVMGIMDHVKILPIKTLGKAQPAQGKGQGSTSNAVKAIEYAIAQGARVINCSFGGGEFSQAMLDAITHAAQKGIFVVVAAGNSKKNNDEVEQYPANYKSPNVISVGSTEGDGSLSSFSNFGSKSVHVFAPGRYIYSISNNGNYSYASGTSESVGFVTGALGLALSLKPNLSIGEGVSKLVQSSRQNPSLAGKGLGGNLDILRFLKSL